MGRVLHLCLFTVLTSSMAMAEVVDHGLIALRAMQPAFDFAKKAAEEKTKLKKVPFLENASDEDLNVIATVLTHLKGRKELKEDLANLSAEYILSAIPKENFLEISQAALLSPLGLPTYLATQLSLLNGAEPNQAQLAMVKAFSLAIEKAKTESPKVDLEDLAKLFLEHDKRKPAPPAVADSRGPQGPVAVGDAGDERPRGGGPLDNDDPNGGLPGGGTPTSPTIPPVGGGAGFPGAPAGAGFPIPPAGVGAGDGQGDPNDPTKNPQAGGPGGGPSGGGGGGGQQKSPMQPPQPGQSNAQYQSKGQPKYDPIRPGEPLKFNPLAMAQNQEPQIMPDLLAANAALARMAQTPRDNTVLEATLKGIQDLEKANIGRIEAAKAKYLNSLTVGQQLPPQPPKVSRNVRLGQFQSSNALRVNPIGQAMQAQPSQIQDLLGGAQDPAMRGVRGFLKPKHRK